ncbi:MAG: 8-oxo-dGTP diphosphatase [Candidatus Aenigmarchaeota archaeon]|nr:8-oxo-dGTP diphosphatase [Candidatus Aenigmarchaeota archaeon]
MKDATLCYLFKDGKVLLQKKAEGKFGGGKWNAPGGKIKSMETPVKAAIREVAEETGLKVEKVQPAGVLQFFDEGGHVFLVHVFRSDRFSGEPRPSREGELQWFPATRLPLEEMWEDDRYWLPALLEGKPFRGSFLFTKGFKSLVKHEVVTA